MAFRCTDASHHRTRKALADVDGHLGHPDECFRRVVPVNPPAPSHGEKSRSLLRSDPGRRYPGLQVHPESERRHRRSLHEVRHRVCCPQRERRGSAICDGRTSGLGTRIALEPGGILASANGAGGICPNRSVRLTIPGGPSVAKAVYLGANARTIGQSTVCRLTATANFETTSSIPWELSLVKFSAAN